ncbi:MAG: thioredoxin family protein [Planctomycetota bacterium]
MLNPRNRRTAIHQIFAALFGILIASGTLSAQESRWIEVFTEGIEKAEEERKDVLLFFTGSDWCPPCEMLESEVMSHEDFQFEASQNYVLIKLDFPKTIVQTEQIKRLNAQAAEMFGVTSYPTVVLTDYELKPFAITGYQAGGVENYLGAIEEFRRLRMVRDEKLKEAESAEGLQRATLLDEAIAGMNEDLIEVYYADIITEIIEIDSDDELGLRSRYNAEREAEMRKIIIGDIRTSCRLERPEQAIESIDGVLEEFDFPADEHLQILQLKLNVVRKLGDTEMLDSILDEMISLEGVEGDTQERLLVKKILLMAGTGRKDDAMRLLEQAIDAGGRNMYLLLAKGELLHAEENYAAAIEAFDAAIVAAVSEPDVLIEAVGGKADAHFAAGDQALALQTLDNFADNVRMPTDLRSEALLHKAMMLRETDRRRQAILAENRAIEVASGPTEKAEVQKLLERLRERFGE